MIGREKTLGKSIYFEGVGLHTGEAVQMTIHPGDASTGIIFHRVDINSYPIPASISNVVDSRYATVLGKNGTTISTVEHLLAALYGMGVDNAFIELNGPEVPAMDGSAKAFVKGILEAGIKPLEAQKLFIEPENVIDFRDDGRRIMLHPEDSLEIDYTINFAHPSIGTQKLSITLTPEIFRDEIAEARTFGFLNEVNNLKEMGFARGGSTDNAIVVGEFGIINADGLRFENEFVRHKILDLIGDLSLLGHPLRGRIQVEKGGHMLNHLFVREIVSYNQKTPHAVPTRLGLAQAGLL